MAWRSFFIKLGRLRLYEGTATPFFLEVPFRGVITGPTDRARPAENLQLDRGRLTPDAHYTAGSDAPILEPLPLSFNFRMGNTEPNRTKFLTIIRHPGTAAAGTTRTIGGKTWKTTKGTTALISGHPEATQLITTPAFIDPDKFTVNAEALWEDPDGSADQGFRWREVEYPPGAQTVTEGDQDLIISMNGQVYGAITTITAFSSGTES